MDYPWRVTLQRSQMLKSLIAPVFLLIGTYVYSDHGQTFEIEEDPMLSTLNGQSIDTKKLQEEHVEEITSYINSPTPVRWLKEAEEYQFHYYDPIYQMPNDITDLDGAIIAKKGQIISPMDKIQTLQDLIFFDGANPKHVEWAKKRPKAKWILVRGSPLDIEETTNHATYFDQMEGSAWN